MDIKTIRAAEFSFCKNLISVIIPSTIISIGCEAFEHNNLTEVIIKSKLVKIDKNTFNNYSLLKTITIPNTIIDIDEYAFDRCRSLSKVIITGGESEYLRNYFENLGITNIIIK